MEEFVVHGYYKGYVTFPDLYYIFSMIHSTINNIQWMRMEEFVVRGYYKALYIFPLIHSTINNIPWM